MEEIATKALEVARPASNLPPTAPRPAAHATPVMDVRPATPQPAAANALPKPVEAASQVHEAPKDEEDTKPGDAKAASPTAVVQPKKAKKQPKNHQPGVGGAIFATVVIVLGLAGLAVYAYLKSQ